MDRTSFLCAALALLSLANRGLTGPVAPPAYKILDNGPGCLNQDFITTPEECATAAASLGFTGTIHAPGSWSHAPPGCHVGHPVDGWAHVYFNKITTGQRGRNIYRSICHKEAAVIPEALALTIPHPGYHHEGECEEEDNILYWGNDIDWPNGTKIMNGSSPIAQCANWCGEMDQCKFWTFKKSMNQCYLKSGKGKDIRINKDRISGSKFCAEVKNIETADCFDDDMDYPGNDIGGRKNNIETAAKCQALCAGNAECFYFTWTTTKRCYLKTQKGTPGLEVGATSGPKACPAKNA